MKLLKLNIEDIIDGGSIFYIYHDYIYIYDPVKKCWNSGYSESDSFDDIFQAIKYAKDRGHTIKQVVNNEFKKLELFNYIMLDNKKVSEEFLNDNLELISICDFANKSIHKIVRSVNNQFSISLGKRDITYNSITITELLYNVLNFEHLAVIFDSEQHNKIEFFFDRFNKIYDKYEELLGPRISRKDTFITYFTGNINYNNFYTFILKSFETELSDMFFGNDC